MGKSLRKLADHTEGILLCLFTLLLVVDVLLGILGRYVNFGVVFADELGKYFFIWLCLTGVSAAARDSQHVRLSFLIAKLPNRKGTWVLSQVLFLIFSLFFLYWSFRLTQMHFVMDKSVMGYGGSSGGIWIDRHPVDPGHSSHREESWTNEPLGTGRQ